VSFRQKASWQSACSRRCERRRTESFIEHIGDMASPPCDSQTDGALFSAMRMTHVLLRAPSPGGRGGYQRAKAALALGIPAEVGRGGGMTGDLWPGMARRRGHEIPGIRGPDGDVLFHRQPGGGKKIIVSPGAAKQFEAPDAAEASRLVDILHRRLAHRTQPGSPSSGKAVERHDDTMTLDARQRGTSCAALLGFATHIAMMFSRTRLSSKRRARRRLARDPPEVGRERGRKGATSI